MMNAIAITTLSLAMQTAQPPAMEVTAPRGEEPMVLINRAARLASDGRIDAARDIYRELERRPVAYQVETTDGRWMYPAEIARRSLKQIASRQARRIAASTK